MSLIKQRDKFSCVACVACMATNTRLIDFERFFFTKGPPFNDSDFYRYLLSHGYVVGVGFHNKNNKIHSGDKIRIEFELKDFPAYVIVKSIRFKGMTHTVYWDGKKVLDPNPEIKKDGLPLERYDVISWFPIVKFDKNNELHKPTEPKGKEGEE